MPQQRMPTAIVQRRTISLDRFMHICRRMERLDRNPIHGLLTMTTVDARRSAGCKPISSSIASTGAMIPGRNSDMMGTMPAATPRMA